eukprot:4262820-Amphidinium_carterae.1
MSPGVTLCGVALAHAHPEQAKWHLRDLVGGARMKTHPVQLLSLRLCAGCSEQFVLHIVVHLTNQAASRY